MSSFREEIKNMKQLPVYNDVFRHPDIRLKLRHPIWNETEDNATPQELWENQQK